MEYGQAKDHAAPGPEEMDVLKSTGEGEKAFFWLRAVGGIVTQAANGTLRKGFGVDELQTERMLSFNPLPQ